MLCPRLAHKADQVSQGDGFGQEQVTLFSERPSVRILFAEGLKARLLHEEGFVSLALSEVNPMRETA
jgi:hypothetical protein